MVPSDASSPKKQHQIPTSPLRRGPSAHYLDVLPSHPTYKISEIRKPIIDAIEKGFEKIFMVLSNSNIVEPKLGGIKLKNTNHDSPANNQYVPDICTPKFDIKLENFNLPGEHITISDKSVSEDEIKEIDQQLHNKSNIKVIDLYSHENQGMILPYVLFAGDEVFPLI